MSMQRRLAPAIALSYILCLSQAADSSSSQYIPKETNLRTCPLAPFPTTNYLYRVPAQSVWDIVAAKHASVFQDSEHAVIVAYVYDKDPWSSSMRNSTLACLHRFYRERDLVFLVVQYEDMGVNEQMQHRIGNLPAFRIFSQGRRFVADGQQSLKDLMETIEANTGVSPVGPVQRLKSAEIQAQLGCKLQVDEVDAEDFARAGKGPWLVISIITLAFLAAWRLMLRFKRRLVQEGANVVVQQSDNVAAAEPLAAGRADM